MDVPVHEPASLRGPGRELTAVERELLVTMLSVEGLGEAEVLKPQASTATAESSCSCGCGSIYLVVDHRAAKPAHDLGGSVIAESDVLDDRGRSIGGLLLFQQDGWLDNLEVYAVSDEPLQLPAPTTARVRSYSERQ